MLSMSFSDRPRSVKIFLASSTTEAGIVGSGVDVEIFAVFSVVVFVYVPIFLQVGIPAVLSLYFDFFAAVIQALVFCMLTMIDVGMANPSDEERAAAREDERLANEQKAEKKRLKKEKKAMKKASIKNV